MSKPSFGYWNIRGFGHPVRLLLAFLGVDYDEKVYDQDVEATWFDEKFKMGLDFPNIPYWKDETVKMTEKIAILKYLSRKYNRSLVPAEDSLWKSEMLEGVLNDTWEMLIDICYRPSEEAESNFKSSSPLKLDQLNNFIGDKSFCMANTPTYIDFMAYEVCYHYTVLNVDTIKTFPNIVRFMKCFEQLAPIATYLKSSKFISGPCFSKHQQKYHI